MVINEEMKNVIDNSAFLTIVTMCPDGTPHPIIVGGGTVDGDNITVGVYAMKVTQENLKNNDCTMMLAAQMIEGAPKGCRFTGTAKVENGKFVFTATKAEALI
ncbi:pyridoxamine 5'-phosphate oxidase family protein [Acetobacterium bakii]|uniref:Pyridoxamine 5'-phosphate oxidase n=1 Tax=Acetobacterium bakii TaxID=52689 RepID=A0A0L6U4L9_9FIRM|nr:pyridoxamine 5'-phosphate oxidase family protein [Acetobacterium bakii]KNZ43464.1 pyridoxamine 5'-phosphate oxidase [Acetobacterium bakii]